MRAFIVLFLVLAAAGTFFFVNQSGSKDTNIGLDVDADNTAAPTAPENRPATELVPVSNSNDEVRTSGGELAPPPTNLTSASANGQTAVVGTVENQKGAAVLGAKVTLTRFGSTTLFFTNEGGIDRSTDLTTKTDEDGVFAFTGVSSGATYAVIVQHKDYSRMEVGPFEVADGGQTQQVIVLHPGTRLTGTITDTGGNSVPNAKVFLGLAAMGITTAEEEADPNMESYTTDKAGQYEFNNLAIGQYNLTVAADGYGRVTLQQLNVTEGEDAEQDLVLEVASALGGTVTSTQGEPIEGAKVEAFSVANRETRTQTRAYTDAAGTFLIGDIPDGDYSLRVDAEGFRSEPWTRAAAGEMSLTIQMAPKPKIRGRVLDGATGNPVTKFTINLRQGVANSDMSTKVQGTTKELTDPEGRFEVDAPLPGEYMVEAIASGFAPTFSTQFRIEEEQELPGITVNLNKGGSISGVLVDPDGSPISGALISTNNNHWTGTAFDVSIGEFFPGTATKVQSRSGADGRFKLAGLTPTTYLVQFEHPEHSKAVMKGVSVAMGQDTNAKEVVLSRGASVSGTVRGPSGSPLLGATVSMQMEAGPEGFPISYTTKTNREGKYTIKHVQGGNYYIHATRPAQGQNNPFAGAMDIKQSRRKIPVNDGGNHQGEDFDLAN